MHPPRIFRRCLCVQWCSPLARERACVLASRICCAAPARSDMASMRWRGNPRISVQQHATLEMQALDSSRCAS